MADQQHLNQPVQRDRSYVPMNMGTLARQDPAAALELLKVQNFLRSQGRRVPQNSLQSGDRPIQLPGNPDLLNYFYLPGRAGGQVGYGGKSSGDDLWLISTASSTRGLIILGAASVSAYDDVNDRLGIGTIAPEARLHVQAGTFSGATITRPNLQITNQASTWYGEDLRVLNLQLSVDEAIDYLSSAGDSDYVESTAGLNGILRLGFASIADPGSDSGHVLRYRAKKSLVGSGNITFSLEDSTAGVIESWTDTINNTFYESYSHSFSAVNIANITNYNSLRIVMSQGGAASQQIAVSLIYLEVAAAIGSDIPTAIFDGASGQTSDLSKWRSSSDADLVTIDASGNLLLKVSLRLEDPGAGTNYISHVAPTTPTTHTLTWPGAPVANGFLKTTGAGVLSWDTTPGAHDLLSATHIDTLAASVVRGDVIVGNATPKWSRLAKGAAGTFLRSDGTDPSWQLLVVGDIPAHNLLSTTHGDTVVGAAIKGKLIVGNTTPKWDGLSVGSDGQVLTADSAQTLGIKWATPSGGTNNLLDGANHVDTVAQGATRGSLIYGNSTPKWDELVVGSARQLLRTDGTDVAWASRSKGVIWLPPTVWLQANGTAASISAVTPTSYPDSYDQWTWVDAPAAGPQGFTTQFAIPQDYVSGTALEIYLHWTMPVLNSGDLAWVFRYHYKAVSQTAAPGTSLGGSWTTTSDTIDDLGLTGGGDYGYGIANKYAVTRIATDLPSTGLSAGMFLMLAIDRLSTDAADNLNKSVRFLGLELRYTRDI